MWVPYVGTLSNNLSGSIKWRTERVNPENWLSGYGHISMQAQQVWGLTHKQPNRQQKVRDQPPNSPQNWKTKGTTKVKN